MRTRLRRRLAACVLAVGAGACGSDHPAAPSSSEGAATLDGAAADLSLAAQLPRASSIVELAKWALSIGPSGCAFASDSQQFVCPGGTLDGVTLTRSYQLFDASGAPQPAYGASTAAWRVSAHASTGPLAPTVGAASLPTHYGPAGVALNAQMTMRVGGLRTATDTIDGTMSLDAAGTLSTGTIGMLHTLGGLPTSVNSVAVTVQETTTLTRLVLSRSTTDRYPHAGTVVIDRMEASDYFPPATTHLVITFPGGQTASVTAVAHGVTTTCTEDLATHRRSCS